MLCFRKRSCKGMKVELQAGRLLVPACVYEMTTESIVILLASETSIPLSYTWLPGRCLLWPA